MAIPHGFINTQIRFNRTFRDGGFIPEAVTFIDAVETAGGSLTDTEKVAIDLYVRDAQDNANAWWNDLLAFWPFVGSSVAAHAINLKTPGTFDITFVNTIAGDHVANGWTPNGTNAYGRTGVIPSTDTILNDVALIYYSRTNNSTSSIQIGCATVSPTQVLQARIRGVDDKYLFHSYNNVGGGFVVAGATDSSGGMTYSRLSATDSKAYRNGSQVATIGTSGGIRPTHEIYLGGRNNAGTADNFDDKQLAGAGVTNGLTAAQVLAEYTALQTLNTSLSRQV